MGQGATAPTPWFVQHGRSRGQGLPSQPGKAQPLGATPIARRLEQVGGHERQLEPEPEPVQRDQPQRQADMIVAVLRESGRAVGRPVERSQEAEIVGCAIRVGVEQRQCAGAVVGHAALSAS